MLPAKNQPGIPCFIPKASQSKSSSAAFHYPYTKHLPHCTATEPPQETLPGCSDGHPPNKSKALCFHLRSKVDTLIRIQVRIRNQRASHQSAAHTRESNPQLIE